jgi:CRISPR-associated endoribonuclease Cas6
MRILLSLSPTKKFVYDLNYYHKTQGFIYNLLKDTPFSILHDKKGYKFFCFSNIFPIGDFEAESERHMLISSPSNHFIRVLAEKLTTDKHIHIGEMEFKISHIKILKLKLNSKNCRLISATPIIIRIPEKNYEKYSIPKEYRKRRFVYWRPQYSFEAFVKQLEENLIKKYEEFYKKSIEIDRIFEMFRFLKGPIVSHVIINGKEQKFIGSIWEFWFSYLNEKQKKILEFGIDAGFGERNSLGFGFINIINR